MAEKITKSKQKRGRGRPTRYSKALGDKICAALSEGKSLRTVCADEKMPDKSTVFRWLRLPSMKDFRDQYARAKEEAADAMAEDMLDIADDGTNDWMEKVNKDGDVIGWIVNGEAVMRSKIRIDARKWLMAKAKPKKYGDKLDVTSDNKPLERPLYVFNMRPADAPKKKSK